MTEIVQIVPKLPPASCGVGDYAYELAKSLLTRHGIKSRFIVCDPIWTTSSGEWDFPCHALSLHQRKHLGSFLESPPISASVVLAQFSGYGYAPRGAPYWLANGLEDWQSPSKTLATMFHELYADGPMTSSSYWLKPLQKWVIKKVARASKSLFTNRSAYQAWLARYSSHAKKDIACIPVFSNLGESPLPQPWETRENGIVAYGLGRNGDTPKSIHALTNLVRSQGIEKVTVMGHAPKELGQLPAEVIRAGFLPHDEAAVLLARSRFGYFDYYEGYLAKSGIFAALCAHGVAPITRLQPQVEQDGLRHGREFFDMDRESLPAGQGVFEALAVGAHRWYSPHNISATADVFASKLAGRC